MSETILQVGDLVGYKNLNGGLRKGKLGLVIHISSVGPERDPELRYLVRWNEDGDVWGAASELEKLGNEDSRLTGR